MYLFFGICNILIYKELIDKMRDKVVIVTGASSGIGRATALHFLKENSKVVLAARHFSDDLMADLKPYEGQYLIQKTDVTQEEDCRRLIDVTIEKWQTIHVLINNAGISMRALFEDVELSVIKRLMDVNFWGAVYCTKFALPYLLKNKGSVAGVSSIAGFKGLPARVGYSASKFALHGFLDVLRTENLKKDLHVLLMAPGFTSSNIRYTALLEKGQEQGKTPRSEEKMMSSEKVAEILYKGIVKRKRQIVLSREGKLTVLFSKFIPKILDRLVYNNLAKEPDSPFK